MTGLQPVWPYTGRVLAGMLVAGSLVSGCGGPAAERAAGQGDSGAVAEKPCVRGLSGELADVPAGSFLMGSDRAYREEAPQRGVQVDGFSIAVTEVTNDQFERFVEATDYVTTAERPPGPALAEANASTAFNEPGAAVFAPPDRPGEAWWTYVPGASWRHPEGPHSSIEGKGNYPVVQVSHADAAAYAAWKGARLPTEAEWEYAARAGRPETLYAWGDDAPSGENWRANTWQGAFPVADTGKDGFKGAAPAGCFEANPWGLYDMTGNVWEWTASPYYSRAADGAEPVMALKGGSFLCAPNFCMRYRPPARQGQEAGLPANHIGFRIASD